MGRQVVLSVNNVATAVGFISGFDKVVTTFFAPSINANAPCSNLTSSSPWQTVVEPTASLDTFGDLLQQVGIDPTSPKTFIGELPLPEGVLTQATDEDLTRLTQQSKRRQRNSKRRRKAKERLAQMTAEEIASSSTTTWHSLCTTGTAEHLAPEEDSSQKNFQPPAACPSQNRRRRKKNQRHRR